ncbi:MAG: hypothetical protein L0229_31185 [Blastocatellia bacterium]|nr:hypothetical protein [Blastocatellia bacterium]
MSRYLSILALLALSVTLLFSSSGHAQREFEEVGKPKPKPKPTTRVQPKGPQRAQVRTNGVLFVLTNPPAAEVVVKNSRGVAIKQGKSNGEGEFRAELAPGLYDVEISAENYSPEIRKKISVKPPQPQILQAGLLPTTGSILLAMGSVDANANILINSKKPVSIVKRGENLLEIEALPAGTYTLRISHPTIAAWENKVEVLNGASTPVSPKFKPAFVNLTVISEPGAEIYVDDNYQGSTAENGEILISNKLMPGRLVIKAVKDKFETATETRTFAAGDDRVELALKRIEFSPEFADSFRGGAASWAAPKAWEIKPGRMIISGPDMGLVRDVLYADFKMEFDISFINGKGAVWIVRARDKQNYYMFQLTGPKGSPPTIFKSYISENGRLRELKAADYVALNLGIKNDTFHITVEAKGNTIKHFIEVTSDPRNTGPQPISELRNADAISHGTVGFGTKDGEEFLVYFVNINPMK